MTTRTRSGDRRRGLLAVTVLLAGSCSFLQMERLEIAGWHPEEEQVERIGSLQPRIRFSAPVEKNSAEEAFSLTCGDREIGGSFLWPDSRTLRFLPHEPLERQGRYCLRVDGSVRDRHGNSLDRDFLHRFAAGGDRTRPRILRTQPPDGGTLESRRAPVLITFSEPMSAVSVLKALSLDPAVRGTFRWDETGRVLTFTPMENYLPGEDYTLSIAESAADRAGNTFARSGHRILTAGGDVTPPELIAVRDESGEIELYPAASDGESGEPVSGWGRDSDFLLYFSEPVMRESAEGVVRFSPELFFRCSWPEEEDTVLRLSLQEELVWGGEYVLILEEGLQDGRGNIAESEVRCSLRVDEAAGRPPQITACSFLSDPDTGTVIPLEYGQQISLAPYDGGKEGFFDLYTACAEDAQLDPLGVMEHLAVTVRGGAAAVRLLSVDDDPAFPPPVRVAEEGESLLRVRVEIDNLPPPGLLTLSLGSGAADTSGNSLAEEWVMQLNTVD